MELGLYNNHRIKALLLWLIMGGIGGVAIDIDHIPMQFGWMEAGGRPLHTPALGLAILLAGYHLTRIQRLLPQTRLLNR